MEQNYLAQIQALIDQKWKENPEEMKRVMAEIKAKEKKERKKPKVETPKGVSFDPQLTQELIEELNKKDWDDIDASKVQDLIKRGADVEAKSNYGQTPLHWASERNYIERAKLLLERGADLEAKDNDGWTPLHLASANNYIELAKLLLDAGADVKAKDNDGWTPLYVASARNHIEIAKFLLERGADVRAKDNTGETPLHGARSDKMKALLQKYTK
jgi:ankyrin repeat protein